MKILVDTEVVYPVHGVDVLSATLVRTPASTIQVSAGFNWLDNAGAVIRRGGYSLPFDSLTPWLPPEMAPLLPAFAGMVPATAGSFLHLEFTASAVRARTSTQIPGSRPEVVAIPAETMAAAGLTNEVVAGLVQQLAMWLTT